MHMHIHMHMHTLMHNKNCYQYHRTIEQKQRKQTKSETGFLVRQVINPAKISRTKNKGTLRIVKQTSRVTNRLKTKQNCRQTHAKMSISSRLVEN